MLNEIDREELEKAHQITLKMIDTMGKAIRKDNASPTLVSANMAYSMVAQFIAVGIKSGAPRTEIIEKLQDVIQHAVNDTFEKNKGKFNA